MEAAAAVVRADLNRMSKKQAAEFAWDVRSRGLYGDGDAAGARRQRPGFYGIRPVRGSHPPVAQRTG